MIKVAIIGTGAISDTHIAGFQKFPERCEIVGLVNDNLERARKKAAAHDLAVPIFSTWDELIQQVPFDLAAVLLPPFVHAAATVDLLNAGKHVLLEKPMALSLAECDAILEAAGRSGTLLSVVAQNRYLTPLMKLKGVLESGVIGKVLHARVDSFWWRGNSYYDLWWRGTWEKEGGGCTLNHAVHHIDLFQWMMGGLPGELQAVIGNLNHTNSEVEDFSTTLMWFQSGAIGQLTASLVHHGEEQSFTFQGERAKVSVPWSVRASKPRSNGFPDDDPEYAAAVQDVIDSLPGLEFEGHDGQILNVLKAIAGEEPLLIDGVQGRNAIELVTAIYQSGSTGERVRLPLAPDSPFYSREGILANTPRFYEKTRSVREVQEDEGITLGSDYTSS